MRLVTPTIIEPLLAEWDSSKKQIIGFLEQIEKVTTSQSKRRNLQRAESVFQAFLERLGSFRVLDPACGSGNFLYLSLRALKDLEHRVNVEAEALGLQRQFPTVDPRCLRGIEINAYAAELARVTIWIGEIQWMLQHGYTLSADPILKTLDSIKEQDAILDSSDAEPQWPEVDVIVGNPPFLGDRKMIGELGEEYVQSLRGLYKGRVPGGADLVVYWHAKALAHVLRNKAKRAGLVATNSIRGGANRRVIDRIAEEGLIYNAWSDEEWVNEGAAVRVSMFCFSNKGTHEGEVFLNGHNVDQIHSDLTSSSSAQTLDLTNAQRLARNSSIAFIGTQKNGPFDIEGSVAREWLLEPNPHGKSNGDVLFPWLNGKAVTGRNPDKWVIDFNKLSEAESSLYEGPYKHVLLYVKPKRIHLRRKWHRTNWWLHGDPRPAMKEAIAGLDRYIITPRVSKYRLFVWADAHVLPDSATVAIARDDDVIFGILQSKFHETWALRMGTSLEDRPRYTPTSTFETFPFPRGLNPDRKATDYENDAITLIQEAAQNLDSLRRNWINPSQWTQLLSEVVEGYPDRIEPLPAFRDKVGKRTLTNLYNENPAWLVSAHRMLDEAVALAYGWDADVTEQEILTNLLDLNLKYANERNE